MPIFSFNKVPVITLDTREDWSLGYNATGQYHDSLQRGTEKWAASRLHKNIARLCDIKNGFTSKKPSEIFGSEAMLLLRAVRSFVHHETVIDTSRLDLLSPYYARYIFTGIVLLENASEFGREIFETDVFADFVPPQEVPTPYNQSLQPQDLS